LFGGHKRVAALVATLGDHEYVLENGDHEVSCARRKIVRGVALKTEQTRLPEWIDQLAQDLVRQADQSESDRAALEKLLTD
jgi:hypothetical protein